MTTPKGPTGPVEGAGLAPSSGLPSSTLATPSGGPTPGVSGGVLRHPGAPTLPEWDPATLVGLITRAANELYAAPLTASVPSTTESAPASGGAAPVLPAAAVAAPSVEAAPVLAAPASRAPEAPASPPPSAKAAEPTAPATPAVPGSGMMPSPFHAPANLDGLDALAGVPSFPSTAPIASFPLVDAPASATAPTPPPRPAAPSSLDVYELAPTGDRSLLGLPTSPFDPHAIRRQFPILQERINGHPLVWLDNAATTQKPQAVIDRLTYFYEHENSNIHRAAHTLAARATDAYESARETVRRFLNASSKTEIVFVRGATEGLNLLAQSWGRRNINAGDEIVISWLEHHANIVPWQMLCAEKNAKLRVAPVDDSGQILLDEYQKLLNDKTKLVSLTQVSNALGTVTPIAPMIEMAHRQGAKVIVDGAQAVSHQAVDVLRLDCDFYVFSGHKVFAPTGIGVVYGKQALLEEMPPWQGGGNMIEDVTFERTKYQSPPMKFEAGTGNIADAVGLGAALDWLMRIGVDNVGRYEHELLEYGTARLQTVPGLRLVGTAADKAGVLSFVLAGQKTESVGGLLDKEGIAVRSGHHCAQPILRRLGLEATVRASLAPYNTCEDLDALVDALLRLQAGR